MKHLFTILDYTAAIVAVILFSVYLIGVFVVDYMKVPQ